MDAARRRSLRASASRRSMLRRPQFLLERQRSPPKAETLKLARGSVRYALKRGRSALQRIGIERGHAAGVRRPGSALPCLPGLGT